MTKEIQTEIEQKIYERAEKTIKMLYFIENVCTNKKTVNYCLESEVMQISIDAFVLIRNHFINEQITNDEIMSINEFTIFQIDRIMKFYNIR